ncbi:MAG TPA: hypothetical protein VK169_15005 [Saprospiraceae bacterium]|nr:hypothetical protein [Saprospiraceae bacterium]
MEFYNQIQKQVLFLNKSFSMDLVPILFVSLLLILVIVSILKVYYTNEYWKIFDNEWSKKHPDLWHVAFSFGLRKNLLILPYILKEKENHTKIAEIYYKKSKNLAIGQVVIVCLIVIVIGLGSYKF